MNKTELSAAIEAMLFASGEPVSAERISDALEIGNSQLDTLLDGIIKKYSEKDFGIEIIRLGSSYQMVSKSKYAPEVRRLFEMKRNTPLSQAAFEVLSVIAYNQPVTKSYVEQVRGVDCSGVVSSLCMKGLIEECGRLDLPGRPLLYRTTPHFLRCFSLESLDDLPEIPEMHQNSEENDEAPVEQNKTDEPAEDGVRE